MAFPDDIVALQCDLASNFRSRHTATVSLLSFNATTSPRESAPGWPVKAIRRRSSTHTRRRSVASMKRLLPLQLSACPPISAVTPPNSPNFSPRLTVGVEEPSPLASCGSRRRLNAPGPITVRRENYRETPVYSEPGSPELNLMYHTDAQQCCISLNVTDSGIASAMFSSYASSISESEDSEDLDEETPAGMSQPSRWSALSFQCLGEPTVPVSCDEGSWLSTESSASKDYIERWLSRGETSSLSDEDSYDCATVLAPARAHVIEVKSRRPSVDIPPRRSSLMGPRYPSLTFDGRRSRTAFKEDVAFLVRDEHAPPPPPKDCPAARTSTEAASKKTTADESRHHPELEPFPAPAHTQRLRFTLSNPFRSRKSDPPSATKRSTFGYPVRISHPFAPSPWIVA